MDRIVRGLNGPKGALLFVFGIGALAMALGFTIFNDTPALPTGWQWLDSRAGYWVYVGFWWAAAAFCGLGAFSYTSQPVLRVWRWSQRIDADFLARRFLLLALGDTAFLLTMTAVLNRTDAGSGTARSLGWAILAAAFAYAALATVQMPTERVRRKKTYSRRAGVRLSSAAVASAWSLATGRHGEAGGRG